ncbi:MAG: UbiA family prenyltransferase [Elusimicrobia bacterium]|nr:UbiA family prenyltransferase [Elusimicrobiota bacterium]
MKAGLDLVKPRIALAAAASAVAVFILASHGLGWRVLPLGLGVFLLACGSAALNQLLERRLDSLMERTRSRPVPSGRLSPGRALAAALLLLAAGLPLIGLAAGPAGFFLSAFAVAWYDGVYTPLKRVTAFAVVPGALVGAVPPVLGWLAAGRPWQDPRLLALCFFFYLWQVPHFWLLVPRQAADLKRAGLPNLGEILGEARLARLAAVWMCTAAASALLLPLFGAVGSAAASALLSLAAGWLTWKAAALLRSEGDVRWRAAFGQLNAFVLIVMALIAADSYL